MPDTSGYQLHIIHSIREIGEAAWNACLGDTLSPTKANPFLSYAFLEALELSGCVCEQTGWLPHHMALRDETAQTLAVLPLYLKSHSQGEYVFDHAWADALERSGGQYYPKLQSAIPFTPVNAPKVLARKGINLSTALAAMANGMQQLCERYPISSSHLTFLPEDQKSEFEKQGFLVRRDQQFHWVNEDYESYDDFLAQLSSRKRKNIRKERKTAQKHGLIIRHKQGSDITEADWDAFYDFYMDTGARKWGRPYLNRAFFSLIGERLADKILLIMAYDNDTPVAGALNFIGGDTLYGRYWGTVGDYPCLHFELCYHQAIDWAIAHKMLCVEAGAQGEHKLARGYIPQTTWSAHWIAHPAFREAIDDYLQRERQAAEAEQDFLTTLSPFKKGDA
ncbi:GNAT family N-acetyltransferase [Cohaesibacter celericrescens]|uniref:GNAT family N-acetyltransferase n=1 Tax=Cohaesibacter celericrescens TaxID=2067669 RepID=A0A2N5XSA9_9HYPH|nr:GNAT family N-acetyltransferase [Cohaesibacter celericrescens]PLW77298.1 GNAT family N-acetyltransferase [Cohaesibacter celericrescens]